MSLSQENHSTSNTDRDFNFNKLTLRSNEVDEILQQNPSFFIKYGIIVILLILVICILLTWFVKYPEVVSGVGFITTTPPSHKITSRVTGKLKNLSVRPNQFVSNESTLCEIESTISLEKINNLKKFTKNLKNYFNFNNNATINFLPDSLTYGILQNDYNTIVKNFNDFLRLKNNSIMQQKRVILKEQINYLKQLISANKNQIKLNNDEFNNIENKYNIDKSLYIQKVYSKTEFLNLENIYIQKKKERDSFLKNFIDSQISLAEAEKQLIQHDLEFSQNINTYKSNILQSIYNIDNLIKEWQQNYLIKSSSSGQLKYLKNIIPNEMVNTGDTLFLIIPDSNNFITICNISANNFGKVEIGQKAIIKLANYPFEEYGSIIGFVENIDLTPTGNQYRVIIKLRKGLLTTYNKKLNFQSEMPCSIEIITNDINFFMRIFYGFRKLLGVYY